MMIIISRLCDKPWLVRRVAEIYLAEWADHYESEWGISTLEDMMDDLRNNYLLDTFVATDMDSGDLVGTVALLEEDLRTHAHLGTQWISCLYVEPWYRSLGVAKKLVKHVVGIADPERNIYIWCYDPALQSAYERMGAKRVTSADSASIVMEMDHGSLPSPKVHSHQVATQVGHSYCSQIQGTRTS
jgi:GNAT superfamily N-acetyltransferase